MFSYPAEWLSHSGCVLAWPAAQDLWGDDLASAQKEFVGLCKAIQGEKLWVLTINDAARNVARRALAGVDADFLPIPYGDIWLRDTAPLFVKSSEGKIATICFEFNGWGEKYVLPNDAQIAPRIAEHFSKEMESKKQNWVLEGGSIEVNDDGICLTTQQCLLNPNRNPHLTKSEIEARLKESLGLKKILWLKEGLINDHTDGHIDTLVRFAPGNKIICMRAKSSRDPNYEILDQIRKDLDFMTDTTGKAFEIIEIPSPGEIYDDESRKIMPASYVNFYISNKSVVVPTYGSRFDDEAVRKISELFPDRKTVGRSAKSILKGGGAFHCITQQIPV